MPSFSQKADEARCRIASVSLLLLALLALLGVLALAAVAVVLDIRVRGAVEKCAV